MPRATTNCIALLAPLLIAACASQPGPQTTVLIPAEHDSTPRSHARCPPHKLGSQRRPRIAHIARVLGCRARRHAERQAVHLRAVQRPRLARHLVPQRGSPVAPGQGRLIPRRARLTPAAAMNDDGPVMVIATMTPVAQSETVPPRTVLLSVELFRPTPGGVRFGNASFIAVTEPTSTPGAYQRSCSLPGLACHATRRHHPYQSVN